MCGQNNPQMKSNTAMYNRELESNRPGSSAGGLLGLFLAAQRKSTGSSQVQSSLPPVQSSDLSIQQQSPPSVRTGSGTRVAARKRATARQSRTKRFTTR
jgi:hypothetical protein